MRNWTSKKRKAVKSAVGALAKLVGGLVRQSDRFPMPATGKNAPSALAPQESSVSGGGQRPPPRRKRVHRGTLAVEDGFKEF